MTTTSPKKGLLIKADPIAAQFRDEVKQALAQRSCRPKLVGILATTSAPSKSYAEFTRKQCEELGFDFILKPTGAAASSELGEGDGVEEAIIEANEDESIHGIMVCGEILTSAHVLFTYPPIILKVYFPIFGAQQVG
jgi:methylenetetrahydrofolate dehydrogenase (NAD+)